MSDKNKIYMIHDNGGRPFKVIANNDGIFVFTYSEYKEDVKQVYDKLIFKTNKFTGYWKGFDTSEDKYHGNSILIHETGNTYVLISPIIVRFSTVEKITDFVSPVINNDVSYPIAFTDNHIVFLMDVYGDFKYINKNDLAIEPTIKSVGEDSDYELMSEYFKMNRKNNREREKFKKVKNIKVVVKRIL